MSKSSALSDFRPFARADASVHLVRAAFIEARAAVLDGTISKSDIAKQLYGEDAKAAQIILRAPSTPIDATTAGSLSMSALGDMYKASTAFSVFAKLREAGLKVDLDGISSVGLPRRTGAPSGSAAWVRPGGATPVAQFALTADTIGPPKKLVITTVATQEIVKQTGQSVFETLLREDIAYGSDAALLSTAAADADRPAGLLYGLAGDHIITAASSGSSTDKMLTDLEALSGTVAGSGGVDIVFIMSPKQSNAARLRLGSNKATVWTSAALAAGVVIAIEPSSFASVIGPIPKMQASIHATLQMVDASPGPLSVAATPNSVAAPIRSTFQTDCVAIRTTLDAAWCMRAPGRVAYLTGATWG